MCSCIDRVSPFIRQLFCLPSSLECKIDGTPPSLLFILIAMHGVRRSSVDHGRSHSGSRKGSLVEAAEKHFDKNTIILIVNVFILMILMSLLYMVATSAMAGTSATGAGSSKDEH